MGLFGNINNDSDEKLMQLVINGNSRAFSLIYDRYSDKLIWYFYRMLGRDEEKARDFMQDIFIKIAEKPHLFDTGKKFSTWVYTVAHNMCKNEYRKLSIRHHVSGDDIQVDKKIQGENEKDLEMKVDKITFDKMLEIELSLIDENHRTAFLLRYKEELSIKEIAEIMQTSEGTVKSRLFYTVKKLSEKLKAFDYS